MEGNTVNLLFLVGLFTLCQVVYTEVTDPKAVPTTKTEVDGCVTSKSATFHACFDALKDDMVSEKPSEIQTFLCSTDQKTRLDCVIKHFQECPALMMKDGVDGFKHDVSGFHAKELAKVSSADDFCKCSPAFDCLQEVEIDKLGVDVKSEKAAWDMLANPTYICESPNKMKIKCVADSLSTCSDYLTYKQNVTKQANFNVDDFDASVLQNTGVFVANQCEKYPEDPKAHVCSTKRYKWQAMTACVGDAMNYADLMDRECGMRKCIEKHMSSCPEKGDMAYFIDSANIFSKTKIATKPCFTSSSSSLMATLSTLFMAYFLSKLL